MADFPKESTQAGAASTLYWGGVAGFAAYLPVPGFRGALYCAIATIPFRRRGDGGNVALAGLLGFLADVVFQAGWMTAGFVWEPRDGYNRILAAFLPPEHQVVTHFGCPVPNSVQFIAGLAGWTTCMFVVWCYARPWRIRWTAYAAPLGIGAMTTVCVAIVLWSVSPMNHWHGRGPHHPAAIESDWWLAVFLAAMPICSAIESYFLWRIEKREFPRHPNRNGVRRRDASTSPSQAAAHHDANPQRSPKIDGE